MWGTMYNRVITSFNLLDFCGHKEHINLLSQLHRVTLEIPTHPLAKL